MFHHYSENSSSTGEPPTPHNLSSNLESTQPLPAGPSEMSSNSSRETSRTLPVQEPDSGYEASPSSIADNTNSYQFFGEQSVPVTNQIIQSHSSRQYMDEETEFLDPHSQFQCSDSESDLEEWDTCPDCSSSTNCDCSRTDSSTTNVTTAISNCDNTTASSSRSNSSDISANNIRPSSQPIRIPILHACRFRTNVIVEPQVDLRLQPARSQPLDLNRHQTFALVTGSHPLSWPSTVALPVFFSSFRPSSWDIPGTNRLRRSNRRHVRSRRQIIDSDASSVGSSDEDESSDEVFPYMAAEEASTAFALCPVMSSYDSSSPPALDSPSSDYRRSRSISVNLPPDRELLVRIGFTLRRLSDQFQISRELAMENRTRRRQTIGSITQLNGLS